MIFERVFRKRFWDYLKAELTAELCGDIHFQHIDFRFFEGYYFQILEL
jgi:hypothetical protein